MPNGLLRWYAACCNTPIGNTPPNFKISFVGLIHNCLSLEQGSLDKIFSSIDMQVNTKYALGEHKPKSVGLLTSTWRLISMIFKARLDGSYKKSPFFDTEFGSPLAIPKVLSSEELKDLMNNG